MFFRRLGLALMAFVGIIFLLFGLFSSHLINAIVRNEISEQLPLVNGSQTFSEWSDIRVPIYLKYYIFSIKNVNEVFEGKEPVFEEKGPFVFKQIMKKEVIKWNYDETLITFKVRKYYLFEPSLSNGNLSDFVSIPNLPLLGIVSIIMEKMMDSWWKRPPAQFAINNLIENYNEYAFINLTVGELLFEGKQFQFFKDAVSIAETLSMTLPNIPENGKFSLMHAKNGSDDGTYTIHTGKSGLNEFGSIVKWNNLSYLSCWNGDECNRIDGTDGMLFHPLVNRDELLRIFSTDMRRSFDFNYQHKDTVQGIETYKFVIKKEELDAPRYSESNKCFCVSNEKENQLDICAYNAMIDMHTCFDGAPVVISLPHFYSSNQSLIDTTFGMIPLTEKHETFLQVNPVTGVVLDAAKRLQLNIHIKQSYGINILENIKKGIYPIAWFEESATIDKKSADDLKTVLERLTFVKKVFMIILIAGVVLVMIATITLIWQFIRVHFGRSYKNNAPDNKYLYSNLRKTQDNEDVKNDKNHIEKCVI